MDKIHLSTQLNHHLIPEIRSLVSNYNLRESKPSYYMVKKEEGSSLTILCICRHSLSPLSEIIHAYYVTMPLG